QAPENAVRRPASARAASHRATPAPQPVRPTQADQPARVTSATPAPQGGGYAVTARSAQDGTVATAWPAQHAASATGVLLQDGPAFAVPIQDTPLATSMLAPQASQAAQSDTVDRPSQAAQPSA